MGATVGTIAFIVLILFAIFFHELGHHVTAKWAGMKVSKFFVGFGPTLWSFRRGPTEVVETEEGTFVERPETEYGVKAFPLGGFVKIVGFSSFEDVPPQDQRRSFVAAPAWKRAIVLVAGSATHAITAFVVLFLIFAVLGLPDFERPSTRVQAVMSEIATEEGTVPGPAFEAGIRPGDEIVGVEGRPVTDWMEFRDAVQGSPGRPLEVTVVGQDGERRSLRLTPFPLEEDGRTFGFVGLERGFETTRIGPVSAVGRSAEVMKDSTVAFAQFAPRAFSPRNLGLVPGEDPGEERAISIVGAGRIAAGLVDRGEVTMFLFLFVQINIFIGIFNLLPLPPLDGGHLLVLAIEKIRRKPVDQRTLVPIMAAVMGLLILIAVLLLFQDIFRFTDPLG